jgi:(p)ppGpp synthase/HD superfamily hydrolase
MSAGMSPTVEQTIEFIKQAHAGQTDKAGEEYWKHPVSVMERLGDAPDSYKLTALLHDVIEDTEYSADDLQKLGYSAEVVRAVELLTKSGEGTYLDEIRKLRDSGNAIAIAVKIADNLDNLDPARLEKLDRTFQLKAEKYRASLAILQDGVDAQDLTP